MPIRNKEVPQIEDEGLFQETERTRLLEAIVERGIRDAIGAVYTEKYIVQTAREWILDDAKEDLTFLGICEELSITDRFINKIRAVIRPFVEQLPILIDNDLSTYPSMTQANLTPLHSQLAPYKVAQCHLPARRRMTALKSS